MQILPVYSTRFHLTLLITYLMYTVFSMLFLLILLIFLTIFIFQTTEQIDLVAIPQQFLSILNIAKMNKSK